MQLWLGIGNRMVPALKVMMTMMLMMVAILVVGTPVAVAGMLAILMMAVSMSVNEVVAAMVEKGEKKKDRDEKK